MPDSAYERLKKLAGGGAVADEPAPTPKAEAPDAGASAYERLRALAGGAAPEARAPEPSAPTAPRPAPDGPRMEPLPMRGETRDALLRRVNMYPSKEEVAGNILDEPRGPAGYARALQDAMSSEAESRFTKFFGPIRTEDQAEGAMDRVDLLEAAETLKAMRESGRDDLVAIAEEYAPTIEDDTEGLTPTQRRLAIQNKAARGPIRAELTDPEKARELLKLVQQRDAEVIDKVRGELYAVNVASDVGRTITFGLFDPLRDVQDVSETEERALQAEKESRGWAGSLGGAAADLAAMALSGNVAAASETAAGALTRMSISKASSNVAGSMLGLGALSASLAPEVANKAEAFTQGALFAGLAQGIGKAVGPTIDRLAVSMGPRVGPVFASAADEAVSFVGAGAGLHGFQVDQAGIDAVLGLVMGSLSRRPLIFNRMDRLNRRIGEAKSNAERDAITKEWKSEYDKIVSGEALKEEQARAAEESPTKTFEPAERLVGEEAGADAPAPEPTARREVAEEAGAYDPAPSWSGPVEPRKTVEQEIVEKPVPGDGSLVNLSQGTINENRLKRNLGELDKAITRGWGQLNEQARKLIAEQPAAADRTLNELRESGRNARDDEVALLTIHMGNLYDGLERGLRKWEEKTAAGDPEGALIELKAMRKVEEGIDEIERVMFNANSEWGRAGRALQMMRAKDMSFQAMRTKSRIAGGGKPLPPEETAFLKGLEQRVQKLEADRDALQARLAERDTSTAIDDLVKADATEAATAQPGKPGYGESNRLFTRDKVNEARERLREKLGGTGLRAGLDPTIALDLARVGAFHIEAGARKFADWARAMIAELGEGVRPFLKEAYSISRKEYADTTRKDFLGKIGRGLEEGKSLGEMSRHLKTIALEMTRSGVSDREQLVEGVRKIVEQVKPDVTRREVLEALSGYGRMRELDPEAAKKVLRDLVAQMQKVAALEDVQAGKPPLKTGWENEAPSDLLREVTRQLNNAKAQGYEVTDPKYQQASALQTVERRLDNAIADIEHELANRQPLPSRRKKTLLQETQRIKDKRARLAELREQRAAMFGKPDLTDAQRVAIAEKALEKSIAELTRRISTGDLFPGKKPRKTPDTQRLDALRAERDALRAELTQLQKAARPAKDPAEVALRAYKTRKTRETADLQRRIANNDFMPKPKRELQKDAEALRIEREYMAVKREFNEHLMRKKLAEESLLRKSVRYGFQEPANLVKALWTGLDLSGVLRQGGFFTIGNPRMAARAVPEMLRAFASKWSADKARAELHLRENFADASKYVDFTEYGDVTLARMEEEFQSRWANKIPLLAGSQRAYVTFLNRLRMDLWDHFSATLSRTGTPTRAEKQAIGALINIGTGRGMQTGSHKLDTLVAGSGAVLWAPKLWVSRVQLATGAPFIKGSARTRRLVAGQYARFAIGVSTLMAVAKMFGAEISTDPKSSDYMKIRFGNTRIDPWVGVQQNVVFTTRLISGEKTTTTGKAVPIRGAEVPFGGQNAWGVITNMARSKLNPTVGIAVTVASGTNYVGEELKAEDIVTPLAPRDFIEAVQEHGIPKGAALGILAIFGMGVQTYEPKRGKTKKKKRTLGSVLGGAR